MEELINAKKRFSKIGAFFLLAVIIIYACELPLSGLLEVFFPQWAENVNLAVLISEICMYLTGFPVMACLLKKYVPAERLPKKRMSVGQYVLAAIMCFGLAYGSNLFGNVLAYFIGTLIGKPINNQAAELISQMHPAMIFVFTVLMAPVLEELFFRKMIIDRTAKYGEAVSILVSGIIFGLFHGNLNQFVYATVIGMFLAFLYVKTGNLKITISLHMLFNFVGGFLSSLMLNMVSLDEYLASVEKFDMAGITEGILQHLGGWMFFGIMMLLEFSMMIAGFVLFIVSVVTGKFSLQERECELPKGIRYSIAFGNLGMVLYITFWVVMIVYRLFVG